MFERRFEVARTILLEKSLDVNAPNNDGETPLLRAVRLDNVELVKLLLARSADPNRSDLFGDTAVVLAYGKGNIEIEKLLPRVSFKGQANVNARGLISGSESGLKFGTALEAAQSANHDQVVTLLKSRKQDWRVFRDPPF